MAADKPKSFPKLIFVFLLVDWPMFMRKKAVVALAEAARRHDATVVAVNRPLCPLSTWIRKPHRIPELLGKGRLHEIEPNLYLFSPRYFIHDLIASRSRLLESLNLWALRKSCSYLFRRIDVREQTPIVWFYHPQQGYVTKLYDNSLNVMEIKDIFADLDGNESKAAMSLEEKLRDRVDLLLCASRKLYDRFSHGYRTAWRSHNGLDRNTYSRLVKDQDQTVPEIERLSHPRIGYTGLISRRLDWDLTLRMAALRPQWNFIFVGRLFDPSISRQTSAFANIHFTGWYDHEEMPAVLRGFDIGFMPYRDNNFFRYSNPLKFYEYAAAGLRTVSSNMEELSRFPETLVRIVPNKAEDWIEAIETFLEADSSDARRIGAGIAGEHIWEDLADELLRKIREKFYR